MAGIFGDDVGVWNRLTTPATADSLNETPFTPLRSGVLGGAAAMAFLDGDGGEDSDAGDVFEFEFEFEVEAEIVGDADAMILPAVNAHPP